ncbi:MAG: rod shape-determining protein MreC, partial [Nitrospina sp.]|nr:rod shape-determining protein MreC [Nitrospina sp.]
LAVVTDSGVIGQVIHAGLNTSKVLLIVDGRSAVDALFQESRISGVVVGAGENECELKFVPNTADVKVGDQVLSSGLGGIFPKGLIIGTVSQVSRKKQGLFQDITLVPSADLSRLEEVLVLLS